MSARRTEGNQSAVAPRLPSAPLADTAWLGIELRHLAAFEAVVEAGSFNQAARRLGYTQSAISQQIRALERIIGHRLLNRGFGHASVSLTPAGERAAGFIRELMMTLAAAEADLAAFASGKAGTVSVGSFQSVGSRVIPKIVHEFSTRWPDIEIRLSERLDERGLFSEVRRGTVELTFGTSPVPPGPFAAVELLRDEYVLILPANWPDEFDEPATSAEVTRLPLLGCYCRSFAAVEAHLRAAGGDPRVVFRSDDNATLLALVATGVGAALMPRLTFDPAQSGIRAVELEDDVPARTIMLGWNSERALSPAASAFVDTAKRVCARWDAPIASHASADAHETRRRSRANPERSTLHAKVEDHPSNGRPL